MNSKRLNPTSIVYPISACSDSSLYPVKRRHEDSIQAYVKVGCGHCDVCQNEKVLAKRNKWRSRLTEMSSYYQEQGDRVVFATLTVHDSKYPTYKELKEWLSNMFHRLRNHRDGFQFKYWAVIEHGDKTGRLHAHVFLFLPKEQNFSELWDYITKTWTERTGAYIFDYRLVDSAPMAAAYATKYSVKTMGSYRNDRMLGSQFGWKKFMELRRSECIGGKVDEWLGVPLLDVQRLAQVESPEKSLEAIENIRAIVRITVDRPVLHPYQACPVDVFVQGEICKDKFGEIGQLSMPADLIWVPASSGLQALRRLGRERLSRALNRIHDLSHTVRIPS